MAYVAEFIFDYEDEQTEITTLMKVECEKIVDVADTLTKSLNYAGIKILNIYGEL